VKPDRSAQRRRASLASSALFFLPRPLFEPRRLSIVIPTAWLTTFIPSILLAALASWLFPTADQPQFDVNGGLALFLLVVFAPIVETLIMGAVLLVLLRFVPATAAVLISAAGWGIAHSIAAPAWGLVIWWPFLVFSILFVTWRSRSLLAALAVPAIVHALHNLPSALLLSYGAR
jgi:hypothetical protein